MESRNYGVLPLIGAMPTNKSYIAGLVTGIPYEVRLPSGKWLVFRSDGEQQFSIYMDSMGCVSFSFNNGVEEGINFLRQTGKLNQELLNKLLTADEQVLFWQFFNDNGQANLSDRALAKLSGTTEHGNSLDTVAATGRNIALPEKVWPYPVVQRTPVFAWADFYKDIDPELVKKYSDVFFKVFTITTEFIAPTWDSIEYHLKQAPVQIASGVCNGWGTDTPIKACDKHNQHATLIDGQSNNYYDFDTYPPYGKELAADYQIDGALKILVELKKPLTIKPMQVKENYLYQLVEAPGGFALGLNGKLVIDDLAKVLASWQVRNGGNVAGKIATCKLADWNSVPHINLKGEIVS